MDSATAFLNVSLPADALPWPILALLIVCITVIIIVLISKAKWYKEYAREFPTQTSTVLTGIVGFAATLALNLCRGALGMDSFDGSGEAYTASCAFAGVGAGALAAKRFSSPEYHEGKAKVEAAKSGAAIPSDMKATEEHRVPGVSRATDDTPVVAPAKPAFGGKSR
jgi:hypothetical protein